MTEALLDHQGTVSIGGRTITNLRLADDIDGLAGTEEELGKLVKRFDDTSSKFGMEINAEKTKLMTNTSQPLTNKITLNGQELEARRIQAVEMRCYRRILGISYKDHVTNESVLKTIRQTIDHYEDLLTIVKKKKLKWYGHVTRSDGLSKTILQGSPGRKKKRQTEEEMG
ncbi:uncharacterized protein [Diadema antillarum]|uniref:uncharacterized protein n=1 Tax=Diadema antillarum TaxID=105358 RepID=UPI003A8A5E73